MDLKDLMRYAFINGRKPFDKLLDRCSAAFEEWYISDGIFEQSKHAIKTLRCPECGSKLIHYSYPQGWECSSCDAAWGATKC